MSAESLCLALSPDDRQRLDVARLKALSARVKRCMESEASHGFEEADWNTYVYLEDEYGLLHVDLPNPVSGEAQDPLTLPRALAMALGAKVRGEHAYLTLRATVMFSATAKATHPGYLFTGCMDEPEPLKPTHAEKVVVAHSRYQKARAVDAVMRWLDEKERAIRDVMPDYEAEDAWEIAKRGAEDALRVEGYLLPPR